MKYFCTLFDSYYLNRGLVMYRSLLRVCSDYHLFIFAFDETSRVILEDMALKNATIISLKEFENEELLKAKADRSKSEYCWTCTPSVIEYCLNQYRILECTYIDADLYFFSDPTLLLDELKEDGVLITSHRYTKKYDKSATSGTYCVQFITFRNDTIGREVLTWWRDRCIEWCYARFENGKFGDQKYLDNWTQKFQGIRELVHEGGGVAPWNIQQYKVNENKQTFFVTNKKSGYVFELIFYHFHAVKFLKGNLIDMGSYELPGDSIQLYEIYIKEIALVDYDLIKLGFKKVVQPYKSKNYTPSFVHKLIRKFAGVYNVMKVNN